MATIPTIQLLRNSNIFSSRDAARRALDKQKGNVPDGGVILARYSGDTGEEKIIKTLAGFVTNISTSGNATVTIIDVEDAINRLDKEDKAVEGQYVAAVSETNGIITVSRQALPSLGKQTSSGKAITAIKQTNGLVDVEFGGVAAANVSVADEGNIFTATTVEGVLSEIQNSLDNAIGVGGSVGKQITNAINALNSETVSGNGQVITAISQSNGIVSATASTLSASSVSFSSSGTSFTADNVKDALDTLYTRSGDGSKVTLESVDGTEDILKVYTIKQGGNEVGKINIPKDLVVTSGSVVKGTWNGDTFTENVSGSGTALKLVIANQTAPVYINTLDLVKDHTSGNGISISDTNVISVVRDPDSDSFLTVGENGVKLSGVQAAISEASGHVNTIIDARLGTGVTSDSTATAQFAELSNKLGTGVTTAATATAQLQALSGETGDTSGFTSVNGAKAYATDLVNSLDATVVSSSGTSTTEAIKILQTDGKLVSITLGAFDCGTYSE